MACSQTRSSQAGRHGRQWQTRFRQGRMPYELQVRQCVTSTHTPNCVLQFLVLGMVDHPHQEQMSPRLQLITIILDTSWIY
jgi:hypothetical protein